MAKPVLYYFDGRGKAEIGRLTMAAVGIDWDEVHLKEPEEFDKLKSEDKLLFKQLPLLEIDGKRLVQSRAIAHYVARKGKLLGDNDDEAAQIEMLFEGSRDFLDGYMSYAFKDENTVLESVKNRQLKHYLPIYEKVLTENKSNGYLVGNKLTFADIGLLEPLLWTEEVQKEELNAYPAIQNFLKTIKGNERIGNYLKSSKRPRINDARYVQEVSKVLRW